MQRKISDILPETEILAQLAEEASELAQAALKLRRALDGTNPTPKSVEECEENLLEELADIWFDAKKVLPEKDKEVLVKREKFGIEIAFLSYDGLWQEHDEYIVFGDVTHWAYLPEPPKEV